MGNVLRDINVAMDWEIVTITLTSSIVQVRNISNISPFSILLPLEYEACSFTHLAVLSSCMLSLLAANVVGCDKVSEWRCANSECVASSKYCNNVTDCYDGTDEVYCPELGMFTNICIWWRLCAESAFTGSLAVKYSKHLTTSKPINLQRNKNNQKLGP